jgi:hypothetical protein
MRPGPTTVIFMLYLLDFEVSRGTNSLEEGSGGFYGFKDIAVRKSNAR